MREPQQERSRRTLNLLLTAAEELLEEKGLEGTTVPAIAERAGLSVGVVYRRFPDKDALLRAVYERFFDDVGEKSRAMLNCIPPGVPLPDLARSIVLGIIHNYRRRRGIYRALIHYARTHHDANFRKQAVKMNRRMVDNVAKLLLRYRDQIDHPDPAAAVQFALLSTATVARQFLIEEQPLHPYAPKDLEEELLRMFFAYLGIRRKS